MRGYDLQLYQLLPIGFGVTRMPAAQMSCAGTHIHHHDDTVLPVPGRSGRADCLVVRDLRLVQSCVSSNGYCTSSL
mgnify:CR=1 FL=1